MQKLQIVAVLLVTASTVLSLEYKITQLSQTLDGEAVLSLEYDADSDSLLTHTREKYYSAAVSTDGKLTPKPEKSLRLEDTVTGYDKSPVGQVTVLYHRRCVEFTDGAQQTARVGQCIGLPEEDLSSKVVGPHDAKLFNNTPTVIIADQGGNKVWEWDTVNGKLTSIADVNGPRGIAIDDSSQLMYIAADHGIYSVTEKKLITGDDSKLHGDFQDGTLVEARFSYPHSVLVLRPGFLVVADTGNSKVRLVDVNQNKVTTLTDAIMNPTALAYSYKANSLYVGSTNGLYRVVVPDFRPKNLCYNLEKSGVNTINYKGRSMQVWCDIDSEHGPWITILKRFDGSQSFDKVLSEYKDGFGDLNGEYWLGLENIHWLTKDLEAKLRIDLEAWKPPPGKDITAYALYDKFMVDDENSGYVLDTISGYSGTAGDMEATGLGGIGGPHKGQKFTTKDRDFDASANDNCADAYNGGWWFRKCYNACLTCGPYRNPPRPNYSAAMIYFPYTNFKIGLIGASMKINLPERLIYEN